MEYKDGPDPGGAGLYLIDEPVLFYGNCVEEGLFYKPKPEYLSWEVNGETFHHGGGTLYVAGAEANFELEIVDAGEEGEYLFVTFHEVGPHHVQIVCDNGNDDTEDDDDLDVPLGVVVCLEDGHCDDGNPYTGEETCTPDHECQPGVPSCDEDVIEYCEALDHPDCPGEWTCVEGTCQWECIDDVTGPEISISAPAVVTTTGYYSGDVVVSTPTDFIDIIGQISDPSGVAEASLRFKNNQGTWDMDLTGLDFFSEPALLDTSSSTGTTWNTLTIYARDTADNWSSVVLDISHLGSYSRRTIGLVFRTCTSDSEAAEFMEEYGLVSFFHHSLLRYHLVYVKDPLEDFVGLVEEISQRPEVEEAFLDSPLIPDADVPGWPDDPIYTNGEAWYLQNSNDYVVELKRKTINPNNPDSVCYHGQIPDADGECICQSDAQCPFGSAGYDAFVCGSLAAPAGSCASKITENTCGFCGDPNADIGWHEIESDIQALIQSGTKNSLVGVIESSSLPIPFLNIDAYLSSPVQFEILSAPPGGIDMIGNLWTNGLECCGLDDPGECLNNGIPDCSVAWESIAGMVSGPCTQDSDCGLSQFCLHVPASAKRCTRYKYNYLERCEYFGDCKPEYGGNCQEGICQAVGPMHHEKAGEPCIVDQDCVIWPESMCFGFDAIHQCSDGCPGACDVDDDGDGFVDWEDPEVHALVLTIRSNLIDDDNDFDPNGVLNDGTVWDGTTCTLSVPEEVIQVWNDPLLDEAQKLAILHACGIDEEDESRIAVFDDDENGYIDDMHGFDFGPLIGRIDDMGTEDDPQDDLFFGGGALWGTTQLDLALSFRFLWDSHGTKVASLIANTVDDGRTTPGVNPASRIVISSLGMNTLSLPLAVNYMAQVGTQVVNMSMGRVLNVVYNFFENVDDFLFATKSLEALFAMAVDTGALYVFSSGNDFLDLDQMASPEDGDPGAGWYRFPQGIDIANKLIVAASDASGRLVAKFYSSYNKFQDSGYEDHGSNYGAATVDLAAPGDHIGLGSFSLQGTFVANGTSYSAPLTAGAASLLISLYPEEYAYQPLKIIQRLTATVTPQADPGLLPDLLRFDGRLKHPGTLDLAAAAQPGNHPPAPAFVDWTWALDHNNLLQTKDLHAFIMDAPGASEGDQALHILEVFGGSELDTPSGYAPAQLRRFDPESGRFHLVTDSVLPSATGNFSKARAVDLDQDGCTDLVLVGYMELEADPSDPESKLMGGSPSWVRFQSKDDSGCFGYFDPADSFQLLDGEATITRDVVIADFDGQNGLDLFFANRTKPADMPIKTEEELWLNDGPGTRSFTQVGAAALPDAVSPQINPRAVTACDIDADGDMDIVEVGYNLYPEENGGLGRDRLLVNQLVPDANPAFSGYGLSPGTMQFLDEAEERWLVQRRYSTDVHCAPNLFHDGQDDPTAPDLFIASRVGIDGEQPFLYWNIMDSDGVFFKVPNGIQEIEIQPGGNTYGTALCDLDGDGDAEFVLGHGNHYCHYAILNTLLDWSESMYKVIAPVSFELPLHTVADDTEQVHCVDLFPQLPGTDLVLIANQHQENRLLVRSGLLDLLP